MRYSPRELFQDAPCGYATTAMDGTVLVVNDTLLRLARAEGETVVGRSLASLLSPSGRLTWENQVVPLLHLQGWARAVEVELGGPGPDRPRVLVSAHVLRSVDDGDAVVRVTAFDATERSRYERELLRARRDAEQSESRLRALHRVVADLAAAPSPQAVADSLAGALQAVFGGSVAVWRAETGGPLVRVAGDAPPTDVLPGLAGPGSLPGRVVADRDVVVVHPTGAPVPPALQEQLRQARLHVVLVVPLLSGEEVLGAYAVGFGRVRAVSTEEVQLHRTLGHQAGQALRRAELNEELGHLALHDPLTGLANRTLFSDRVDQALARSCRSGGPVTVMVLDLDGFKAVNDEHGHRAGDSVLAEAARRFVSVVRPTDTVARMGGDEFTMLAEGLDEAQAAQVATRVELAMRPPVAFDGGQVALTTSVGLVHHAPGAPGRTTTDASQLIQAADAAMYDAKRRGRGGHAFYDAALRAASDARTDTLALLERALAGDDGVVLHYQPVFSLRERTVVGVEALCRLVGPDGRLVAPDDFIPVAEEAGLMPRLGLRVLDLACRQAAWWHSAGRPLPVAINVAAVQAADPGFADVVAEALERSGCPARLLTLELTESALLQACPGTVATLEAVRDLGISLALDDFGTRYASLHYLQEFPLDTLKIDRSFVAGVPGSRTQTAIVGAVAALAADLGMTCVAEGIETQAQLDHLTELDVLGQGYLLARPQPAQQVGGVLGRP